MELFQEIVDPSHSFTLLRMEDIGEVAKTGRSNCVLSIQKLTEEGISMRPVEDAVREALQELKMHLVVEK